MLTKLNTNASTNILGVRAKPESLTSINDAQMLQDQVLKNR